MVKGIVTWVLLVALLAAAEPAKALGGGDLREQRDVVTLNSGKEIRGRLVQRHGSGPVLFLERTNLRTIDRSDVQQIHSVRDSLRTFISERKAGQSIDDDWKLVARADELELHEMAVVQALYVVCRDPLYRAAHEYLGHRPSNDEWLWPVRERSESKEEFDRYHREWDHRIVLKGEHFTLETNTSIQTAVDLLFELEGVYLLWMDQLGDQLLLAEDVYDQTKQMVFCVFATREDREFSTFARAFVDRPFYGGGIPLNTATPGNNVAVTYFEDFNKPPVQFLELAVQQLAYSTLVLGTRLGDYQEEPKKRPDYWIELGLGYWFACQLTTQDGRVLMRGFTPDSMVVGLSRQDVPSPRRRRRALPKTITTLVPMSVSAPGPSVPPIDARARRFFSFLMTTNPTVGRSGSGAKDGVFRYIRDTYRCLGTHSPSIEECLGGDLEDVAEDWLNWLEQ